MNRPNFRCAAFHAAFLLLAGCGGKGGSEPSAPALPSTPAEIEEMLAKGGAFWGAPPRAGEGAEQVVAGTRFWIWPADADAPVVKDGDLHLRFHWRVRPGQTAPGPRGQDDILFEFKLMPESTVDQTPESDRSTGATYHFMGGAIRAKGIDPGATEGVAELAFDAKKHRLRGEGVLLLYLEGVGQGLEPPPTSNLLRVKVRFE